MDTVPFLHADRVFTIVFLEDLTFSEVRQILDQLLAEDAFSPEIQAHSGVYQLDVQDSSFTVWVSELGVIIKRIQV